MLIVLWLRVVIDNVDVMSVVVVAANVVGKVFAIYVGIVVGAC